MKRPDLKSKIGKNRPVHSCLALLMVLSIVAALILPDYYILPIVKAAKGDDTVMPVADKEDNSGLLLWLDFSDSDDRLKDRSGHGVGATVEGGSTVIGTDEEQGDYLDLTTSNAYLSLSGDILSGLEELTVEMKIKADTKNAAGDYVANWAFFAAPDGNRPDAEPGEHYLGILLNDRVTVERYATNGARPTNPFITGWTAEDWHTIRVVFTKSSTILCVDGKAVSIANKYSLADCIGIKETVGVGQNGEDLYNFNYDSTVLWFGYSAWGEDFNGCISDIKIWDHAVYDSVINEEVLDENKFTVPADSVFDPKDTTVNMFDYWITGQYDNDFAALKASQDSDGNITDHNDLLQGINYGHLLLFAGETAFGALPDIEFSECQATGTEIGAWNRSTGLDDDVTEKNTITQGIVQSTLDGGYPKLALDAQDENGEDCWTEPTNETLSRLWADNDQRTESLDYLFDPDPSKDGNSRATYPNVTGLFQINSDGYYQFHSWDTFAELNAEQGTGTKESKDGNHITLYKKLWGWGMPWDDDGQFFPFNDWSDMFFINQSGEAEQVHKNDTANQIDGGIGQVFTDEPLNHYFGMTVETKFQQPFNGKLDVAGGTEPMRFDFSGDDDVWIFIDDVLVGDLGGIHGWKDISIDFSTGEIQFAQLDLNSPNKRFIFKTSQMSEMFEKADNREPTGGWKTVTDDQGNPHEIFADNSIHTLKFFYLERGNQFSNCNITFNLQSVKTNVIVKEDDKGKPLQNAEFQLYAATLNPGVSEPCSIAHFTKGTDIDIVAYVTTGIDGTGEFLNAVGRPVNFDVRISDDYYILSEVNAPEGYRLNNDIVLQYDKITKTFSVVNAYETGAYTVAPDPSTEGSPAEIHIPDMPQQLIIRKVDENGKPLEGAEFALYENLEDAAAKNGNSLLSGTTQADGMLILNKKKLSDESEVTVELELPDGCYWLREIKAPDWYLPNDNLIQVIVDRGYVYINATAFAFDAENNKATAVEGTDNVKVYAAVGSLAQSIRNGDNDPSEIIGEIETAQSGTEYIPEQKHTPAWISGGSLGNLYYQSDLQDKVEQKKDEIEKLPDYLGIIGLLEYTATANYVPSDNILADLGVVVIPDGFVRVNPVVEKNNKSLDLSPMFSVINVVEVVNEPPLPPVKEETTPNAGDTVNPGDTIDYTISWGNYSGSEATMTFTDVLDINVDFVSASYDDVKLDASDTTGSKNDTGKGVTIALSENEDGRTVVTWTITNVPCDKTVTVNLTVKVKENISTNTKVENQAKVKVTNQTTNEEKEEPTNKVENPVEVIEEPVILGIIKKQALIKESTEAEPTADPLIVTSGDKVTYYLTLKGEPNSTVEGVVVQDTIPEGLELVEGSILPDPYVPEDSVNTFNYNNKTVTIEWRFETVKFDDDGLSEITLSYTVTVPPVEAAESWTNIAYAASGIGDNTSLLPPDDPAQSGSWIPSEPVKLYASVWCPKVEKEIVGRPWVADDKFVFVLELYDEVDEEYKEIGRLPINGNEDNAGSWDNVSASFDPVEFDKSGTYTFRLREEPPVEDKEQGLIYDNRYYVLTVKVDEEMKPSLDSAYHCSYSEDGTVKEEKYNSEAYIFKNTYDHSVTVPVLIEKVLEGWDNEEFDFTIEHIADNTNGTMSGFNMDSIVLSKDENTGFFELTFKSNGQEESEYIFEVAETPKSEYDDIIYADPYKLTIKVIDDMHGNLKCYIGEDEIDTCSLQFVNKYKDASTDDDTTTKPSPTVTTTAAPPPTESTTAEPSPTESATAEPPSTVTTAAEPTPTESAAAEPPPAETTTAELQPTEAAATEPLPTEPSAAEPPPSSEIYPTETSDNNFLLDDEGLPEGDKNLQTGLSLGGSAYIAVGAILLSAAALAVGKRRHGKKNK